MKVFISWSGDLSKELGEAVRRWFPSALQTLKPYFTPNDIEKGARWGDSIALELQESEVGIICLTPENLENPWIMFEAGAISKIIGDSNLCPILFGLEPKDISGPLSQFQLTQFRKEDMQKLFSTVNRKCGENKLDESMEMKVFEKWWPELEEEVSEVLSRYKIGEIENIRSDREVLDEILSLSRYAVKKGGIPEHLRVSARKMGEAGVLSARANNNDNES